MATSPYNSSVFINFSYGWTDFLQDAADRHEAEAAYIAGANQSNYLSLFGTDFHVLEYLRKDTIRFAKEYRTSFLPQAVAKLPDTILLAGIPCGGIRKNIWLNFAPFFLLSAPNRNMPESWIIAAPLTLMRWNKYPATTAWFFSCNLLHHFYLIWIFGK